MPLSKKLIFILLLCIGCSLTGNIDSVLSGIQNNKISDQLADEAINLPYDKIVNNLSKSAFIFKSLYENGAFTGDKQKRGTLIEKLALVTYLKGNGEESFRLHKEAIGLFNAAKDFRRKANALAAMGYESKRRNLSLAMDIMREAIGILVENKYYNDLPGVYDNFGVLFEMKERLDSAEFYYQKALSLKRQNKDSIGVPYSLNNLAGLCFMKKDLKKGLEYIDESSRIRENLKDYLGIGWNEFSVGEMYIQSGDFPAAEKHIRRSLRLAREKGYPELIARNIKFMAAIFANRKQFDSAYVCFNRFYTLNDSLYNVQKQNQILEMETVYETEKKSYQIKALNDENSLKETELQKKRNMIYSLIVIVILFAAGGILLTRAYQQKKKANRIISLQKLETERQKMIIQEKQIEILDSIHYAKRIQQSLMPGEKYIHKTITKLKPK